VKVTTGEGTCHAHSEADGNGEEAEQNQVDRVLLVVVVEWAQHCTAKRKKHFQQLVYNRHKYLHIKSNPHSWQHMINLVSGDLFCETQRG